MNALQYRIAAIPKRFAQWTERGQKLTPQDQALNRAVYKTLRETPQAAGLISAGSGS